MKRPQLTPVEVDVLGMLLDGDAPADALRENAPSWIRRKVRRSLRRLRRNGFIAQRGWSLGLTRAGLAALSDDEAPYEFRCPYCTVVTGEGTGRYAGWALDGDGVHREEGDTCERCAVRWYPRFRAKLTEGRRWLYRHVTAQRIWCRIIGGSRYTVRTDKHGIKAIRPYWVAAVVCRFRKHVLDGSETEWGPGGDKIDAMCTRCFFFRETLPLSEALWAGTRIRETFEPESQPDWKSLSVGT